MMPKLISVCVPCYNEEANIEDAYEAIVDVMESIPDIRFEVLFEDNASQDRSADILRSLAAKDPRVKVIINDHNYGPNRSGSNCLFRSAGDAAVLIPCDLQDPPDLIPRFVELWNCEPVAVLGQREDSLEPKAMSCVRSMYYWVINNVFKVPLLRNVDGFGLYDRRILREAESFCSFNRGMKLFVVESRCGVRLVRYAQGARKGGRSSYSLSSYLSLAFRTILEASEKPAVWCRNTGLISGALSLAGLVYFLASGLCMGSLDDAAVEIFGFASLFLISALLVFTSLVLYYVRSLMRTSYRLPLVHEKEALNMEPESRGNR